MEDRKLYFSSPTNESKSTNRSLYIACGLLATIILIIDLSIPLGVASGVPYIAVVLISLKSPNKSFTILAAVICSLFVLIGFLASPDGGIMWQVIANRAMALFAIWTTAILALIQFKREEELHQEKLKNLQVTNEIELQKERLKILKATMRTVQDIVGNFLNNLHFIRLEVEDKKTLSSEALDTLDTLVKDTSSKINKLGNLDTIREKKIARDTIGIDYEFAAPDENLKSDAPPDIDPMKKI